MAREVERLGHQCVGDVGDPGAARAARESGLVDLVAFRMADLTDLVDWLLPLDVPHARPRVPVVVAGLAVLLIEAVDPWLAGMARVL